MPAIARSRPSIFAWLVFRILFAPGQVAALTEVDLAAPGDGLVSRDVTRGIDWLDLPLTVGLSIDDVLNGAGGWTSQSWRLASSSEVCGLAHEVFGSVACPTPYSSASIYFDDRAIDTINLLGITVLGSNQLIASTGYFDDGDLSDGEAALASYIFFIGSVDGEQSQFNLTENTGPSIFFRSNTTGVFLVRPIPEPGTAALLAMGVVALSARGAGSTRTGLRPERCTVGLPGSIARIDRDQCDALAPPTRPATPARLG